MALVTLIDKESLLCIPGLMKWFLGLPKWVSEVDGWFLKLPTRGLEGFSWVPQVS